MSGRDGATLEWSELISEAIESRLLNVRVALPGIVIKYDAAKQVAEVQPAVRRPVPREDGSIFQEPWPAIPNVPVLFAGAASYSEHFPLAAGDIVDLVFQDFSIAAWRQSGRVSDALDTEHHGPSYPIAIPWYRPAGGPGADTDGPSAGRPGGLRVYYGASTVDVGKGAGLDAVAMAAKTNARLDALETALIGLVLPVSGSSAGPPAVPPVTPGASVASTNLRAK